MPTYLWSTTAASNATADPTINYAEGQAPSSLNDSARAQMAAEKKFYNDALTMTTTTSGTSTAYTLATNSVFDTLAHLDKQQLTFVPHATSGASPTLAVDGLAAKPINGPASGTAIPTGALVIGVPYTVLYDNTNNQFILLGYRDTLLNATITGTLSVTSTATLSGNATVGGTLGVTGVATFTAIPVFSAGIDAATATTQSASDNSTKVATTAYVQAQKIAPTIQSFTSGSAQTYTPTAGFTRIRVRICGGGGGGGAVATNNGTAGNTTSLGGWTAVGGSAGAAAGGAPGAGGTGGTNGTGTLIVRIAGGAGQGGRIDAGGGGTTIGHGGGAGGTNPFGGAGTTQANTAGGNGAANTGAGGSGGGLTSIQVNTGSGGGSGEYVEFWMTAAQVGASLTYTVGAAANGGAAGTKAGGNGAAGIIIIEEFYW